jgi:hypothetical protein
MAHCGELWHMTGHGTYPQRLCLVVLDGLNHQLAIGARPEGLSGLGVAVETLQLLLLQAAQKVLIAHHAVATQLLKQRRSVKKKGQHRDTRFSRWH